MLIFGAVAVLGMVVYAVDGPSSFMATVGVASAVLMLRVAWEFIANE